MKYYLRKRFLIGVFIIITVLLAVNIVFTYRNSKSIESNMQLQQRSEKIKMVVSHIAIDIIHNLDLGIRSYALFKEPKYLYPYYKALERKDSILHEAEVLLLEENYAIQELQVLEDSVEAYVALNARLKILVDDNNDAQFLYLANQDRGYALWLQYEQFANHVNGFEDEILQTAKSKYGLALRNNYYLQYILFSICIPTLLFTIIKTFSAFVLEKKLRQAETDRANLLKNQNKSLEKIVNERTKELTEKNKALQQHDEEIAAQNEEIRAQNELLICQQDQIVEQNGKLKNAFELILSQQREIEEKNENLETEVQRKTKELVISSQQLEQFAFVSAHNLRAPVARILGLGNLLKRGARDKEEENFIVSNIIKSTFDLDMVVKDLTLILGIKTNINAHLCHVNFRDELQFVKSNLAKDVWESDCQIIESFEEAPSVITVKAYVDSILFNLISNSIKYRSPDRVLNINVKTFVVNDFICLEVMDNGMGIDLKAHGKDIFSLYKRFHTHTEGRGLGLHLVKMQAIALGGSVDVSSQPGVGSIFKVYIKTHPATTGALN